MWMVKMWHGLVVLELNVFQKELENLLETKKLKGIFIVSVKLAMFKKAYDSLICGYFCIGFIDFILKDKNWLDYTNLFSPSEYKKWQNNIKILSISKKMKTYIVLFAVSIEHSENLKYHTSKNISSFYYLQ